MSREAKMVIVMRKDLGMRAGKMIAQGAHAAIGAANNARSANDHTRENSAYRSWLESGTTKICVRVDSGAELLDVERLAQEANLPVYLVTDAGRTEIESGTITCLAIGPMWSDEIDRVTGELKLL